MSISKIVAGVIIIVIIVGVVFFLTSGHNNVVTNTGQKNTSSTQVPNTTNSTQETAGTGKHTPILIGTLTIGSAGGSVSTILNSKTGYIYAAVQNTNTIYVVSGNSIIGKLNVPNNLSDGLYSSAYASKNDYIYVVNGNDIAVVSGTSVIQNIPFNGGFALQAVYDPLNGYAYVFDFSGMVLIISGTSIIANITLSGSPETPIYDAKNGNIYILTYNLNSYLPMYPSTLYVISGTSVIANISAGFGSDGLAYDQYNGYVYYFENFSKVGYGNGTISVISGTSIVTNLTVGPQPNPLVNNTSNGYLYFYNSSKYGFGIGVSAINGTILIGNIIGGQLGDPQPSLYDPANRYIYIPLSASNKIFVVNGTALLSNVSIQSPLFPLYDPQNGYIYVTQSSGDISFINGTTILGNIPLGTYVGLEVYDPVNGYVYVPGGYGTLSILSS